MKCSLFLQEVPARSKRQITAAAADGRFMMMEALMTDAG
jgi:hypothetical protein